MCITVPPGSRPAGTSHSSLMPSANTCGWLADGDPRTPYQLLRQISAHAVGKNRDLGANIDAWLEVLAFFAVPADAAIAGPNADNPISVHQQLAAGKPREHVYALGFDEARQPFAELLERDDVVAVILQRRRRDRKFDLAGRRQEVDAIFVNLRGKRRALGLEIGHELRERARIENGARQQMRARLGGFLEHGDAERLPAAFCSCASRSAADSPAGPPPTIRMSTSSVSRSLISQSQRRGAKTQRMPFL